MLKDNIFWFKNKLFRSKAIQEYKQAINNLKLSKDQLNELNWNKRKAIVKYAYQNSTFYHNFYDNHGFHPSLLRDETDWEKVPIVEKNHIRNNTSDIITIDKSLLRKNVTGGSTGEPLICYHDSRFHQEILDWRMYKVWNVSPAENRGKVWRMPSERASKLFKFKNKLIWYPTHQVNIDASGVTNLNIKDFLAQLNKLGSCILYGYTGSISEIAKYIINNNLEKYFAHGKIKLVTTFASPVTTVDRELAVRAFGCKMILDQYCCNEISNIAFSTPSSNNLCINWDYRHIDIVNNDVYIHEANIHGDVVITDLNNYGFPLIKYRLGDKTSWVMDECDNLVLPRISPIKGRISDLLMLPNGGFIEGGWLTSIFDPYPNAVLGFQIYQKKDYSIILYVIPNKSYSKAGEEINKVVEEIKRKSNNEVDIKKISVEEITSDRGKQRYIISEIKIK